MKAPARGRSFVPYNLSRGGPNLRPSPRSSSSTTRRGALVEDLFDPPGRRGALTPGQYLVAVEDQISSPPPTRVAILTQVVGLLVCPGGLGNASPGCTFAP
jgi:hypothetical protein